MSNNKPRQCHNCQMIGYASYSCHANPKCVKCAGNHTKECKKTRYKPSRCVNYGGEQLAHYGGCEKNPANTPKQNSTTQTTKKPFVWGQQQNQPQSQRQQQSRKQQPQKQQNTP